MTEYNFKEVESKWQKYWTENSIFTVDIDLEKPKFIVWICSLIHPVQVACWASARLHSY